MKVSTKLILVTTVALMATAVVIGFLSVFQIKSTGQMVVERIEMLSRENINKTEADGQKQLRDFREELLSRKKEYLKSQIQTTMGVLQKGYGDAHDLQRLKAVYREQLQNSVNTVYGILQTVEKENGLSLEDKQHKAINLISALRYGPENKDYFWINDVHPTMVMHPYNTVNLF